MLPLKYLPLAWAAVLVTSLITRLLVFMGVDLSSLAGLLGLGSSWILSLVLYGTSQFVVVLLLIYLLRGGGVSLRDIGFGGAFRRYYIFSLGLVLVSPLIWSFCDFMVGLLGLSMWWSGRTVISIRSVKRLYSFPHIPSSPLRHSGGGALPGNGCEGVVYR